MDKFNCNQLKNVKVPEAWIENALNIPEKKNSSAAPKKLFRMAAGIAACVVIAAAVMFSMLFGINKNVSLTAPHPDPSQADIISGGTAPNTTHGTEAPSGIPPVSITYNDQSPTTVTEPGESGSNDGSDPEEQQTTSASTAADSADDRHETTLPDDTEEETVPAATTVPSVEGSTPTQGSAAVSGCTLLTHIEPSLAAGEVYCRLEGENGEVLGDKNPFAASHLAIKENRGNNRVLLTYRLPQSEAEIADGRFFSVLFYDSDGVELKKSAPVVIYKELYFMFN